jgi:hypothetical protein
LKERTKELLPVWCKRQGQGTRQLARAPAAFFQKEVLA